MKVVSGAATVALIAVMLTGCAPTTPDGFARRATAPTEITAVHYDVSYYPACGNEVLTGDVGPYYPFRPRPEAGFPEHPRADALAAGFAPAADARAGLGGVVQGGAVQGAAVAFVPAVVAPGPGDDVGTLVLYDGGRTGYWESDSGDISTWLTGRPLTYTWVC